MPLSDEFKAQGYVVLRGLVAKPEIDRLYAYTLATIELGNKDDGQVPGSPSFYEDKEGVLLQQKLSPLIEKYIQIPLKSVYCYHRVYRKGAILRSHKDSIRNEISATINLGYQGEPWDLWLLDYQENPQKVTLSPGDALIYKGAQLIHWRGKLEHGDYVSQIMFGFIDRHGKNQHVPVLELIRKWMKKWRVLFGIAY